MTLITIDHLVKDYGAVRAVDDLTFTVEAGTIAGFLGPNGSGKTTTLSALLGLVVGAIVVAVLHRRHAGHGH